MKNSLTIIALLFYVNLIFSQEQSVVETQRGLLGDRSFSPGSIINNPPNDIIGSVYLFDTWDNTNFVHLIDKSSIKKSIKLKSININVELNKFTYKINDKDVYSFHQDYFEYVIINNRRFEFFENTGFPNQKIYEIIGNLNNKKLIKGFSTYTVKGEPGGYPTSTPADKIKIRSQYYILKDGDLVKTKLKKKDMLAFMKDKKESIITYVKKEKLSYKKEKDLRAIFRYYNSL